MTVRVTQVFLEVLTTKGTPLNGYADAQYAFDFTLYSGYADATYELDAPTPLNGYADGQFSLPEIRQWNSLFVHQHALIGFFRQQAALDSQFFLDAGEPRTARFDSQYRLNEAIKAASGWADAAYVLNAWEARAGYADHQHSLAAAFQAMNAAFVASFSIPAIFGRTGYADAEYVFDAYVPNNGFADGTYEFAAFIVGEAKFGSQYLLDTFQALEAKREAQYTLVAGFKAAEGYADATYQLQVRQLLSGYFDGAFGLEALLASQTFFQAGYTLNEALAAVDGFADAQYILNAYIPANGYADGQNELFIYTALNGWSDAQFALAALLQQQGWFDHQAFLDVTDAVYTWIVNQNTGAPARYENHDFHSFGKIGSDYLGAKADGIYLLDGDDDEGAQIDAIASTGRLDFGSNRAKRVLAAYLGMDSAGQINITLRTDADKSFGPYQFRVTPTGHQVERVKFSKGVKSRYWEFDIENVLGGELSLDEIQFDVVELLQRLKR